VVEEACSEPRSGIPEEKNKERKLNRIIEKRTKVVQPGGWLKYPLAKGNQMSPWEYALVRQ